MTQELVHAGGAGTFDAAESNALASLLALTSDAVLIFGRDGVVTLANENAEKLFRVLPGTLVGSDVRLLFPPPATIAAFEGPLEESLPFSMDGGINSLVCEGSSHVHLRVLVRCEPILAGTGPYILCARPAALNSDAKAESDRLVDELSRANRRLSGTLDIVLGTLDALDLGTLFSRILDEIAQTMDAWATLAYMAESDGYRLRGATKTVTGSPVPARLSYSHRLVTLALGERRSLSLRVQPIPRERLRSGDVSVRTIVDEATGTLYDMDIEELPPFASFAVVPVWFGGQAISLLVVGWRHTYGLRRDDMRLLDGVAEYLSVQLAGAFAAMRAQHEEKLESLGTTLRERLLAGGSLTKKLLCQIVEDAATGIEAHCIPLEGNTFQRITMGDFTVLGHHSVPIDLTQVSKDAEPPRVMNVLEVEGLSEWLTAHGEPSKGLLALVGKVEDRPTGFLLVRAADDEPFEDVDVAFVRRLAEDICEVVAGTKARIQDKHISQALQMGMRNELQQVEGISTQSRYSSATEAAYVGGDFYDLVRLPNRRACAIMGDVSGKGVEAASVSSAVKTALAAYAWEGIRPARMVSLLNDFLLGFSRIETFATMFVGIIDLRAGELAYCSAGHPPALLVRGSSNELVTLGVQSGVVGAFEGLRYKDGHVSVEPGDILLLYTDGVTEARNSEGAFFGEDGLRDAVSTEAARGFDGLCERVLNDVSSFAGNSLDDDVALVVLRIEELFSEA